MDERLVQAVADSGLEIQHRRLAGLLGIYYPPSASRPHGLLTIDGDDTKLVLCALAHLDLGHERLRYYAYGPGGEALYDSPREQLQVQAWAEAFEHQECLLKAGDA